MFTKIFSNKGIQALLILIASVAAFLAAGFILQSLLILANAHPQIAIKIMGLFVIFGLVSFIRYCILE